MKKFIIIYIISFPSLLMGQGNNKNAIKVLTIGDKVPDVILSHVVNDPDGTVKLSDFRGRWLILDFWATWCSPCIAMFPRTDSLQKVFSGRVQFLAVTYEEQKPVKMLFSKLKGLQGIKPLIETGDNTLRFMFPHTTLPHYVWINPEGKVAAITGMEDVTMDKLSAFLMSQRTNVSIKKDVPITFTRNDHLIKPYPGATNNFIYSSMLTGYVEGASSFQYMPDGEHILAMNLTLMSLYSLAYGERIKYFGENLINIEIDDPEKLKPNLDTEGYRRWIKSGGYCYEIAVNKTSPLNAYKIMQEDLARQFPQYRATVETRHIPVLALVRTSNKDKIRSSGGECEQDIKPFGLSFKHCSLNGLTRILQIKYLQHLSTPVINETDYSAPVELKIEADLGNVDAIRKALHRYDLDLVKKEADMEVLVIRDTGAGSDIPTY